MNLMKILPYEIMDSLQDFLVDSAEFETFLNTQGFTNQESTELLKQVSYIQSPKQQISIKTFPFISFESLESADVRTQEDGFRWFVDIVIGLTDIDEDNLNHKQEKTDNILKYTKLRDAQDFGKQILEIIDEEIRISGIKGDFEIFFGRIGQLTTPTGEFDEIYHMIELELISHKEL